MDIPLIFYLFFSIRPHLARLPCKNNRYQLLVLYSLLIDDLLINDLISILKVHLRSEPKATSDETSQYLSKRTKWRLLFMLMARNISGVAYRSDGFCRHIWPLTICKKEIKDAPISSHRPQQGELKPSPGPKATLASSPRYHSRLIFTRLVLFVSQAKNAKFSPEPRSLPGILFGCVLNKIPRGCSRG